jgi:cell wall-associated NlpC family hydrolase
VASRVSRRGAGFLISRFLLLSSAITIMALVGGQFAVKANPQPTPKPTVASATQKLNALSRQASELTEQYNLAQADLVAKQAAADRAAKRVKETQAALREALVDFRAVIVAQYEAPAFSATGALLTSTDDQNYLDRVNNLKLVAATRGDVVSYYSRLSADNNKATKDAAVAVRAAAKVRDDLRAKKAAVEASIAQSKRLVDSLTAAQRRTYYSSSTVASNAAEVANVKAVTMKAPLPNPAAASAVAFAYGQVGKPYVYGTNGLATYDCSGLTSRAWSMAGVSLPHSAREQFNYGKHISFDQLLPGDLIFLYRPISHVEIYIGAGYAISAPQSGEPVKVITVSHDGDYVGATRL